MGDFTVEVVAFLEQRRRSQNIVVTGHLITFRPFIYKRLVYYQRIYYVKSKGILIHSAERRPM